MNNRLANELFRLSGFVTGMKPHAWLDRLEAMQWWGHSQMLDWQSVELTKMLEHAISTVPYYERVLSPIDAAEESDVQSRLRKLPVLTKEQVRENFQELQSTLAMRRKPLEFSTSGSTGKPLKIRVDRAAFARYFSAKFRALGWYGVDFADRQVRIWGFPFKRSEQITWRLRDLLQNRLRLISFDLSTETLEHFYRRCLRFQPVYINGYTSAIHRFASFIEESGKEGASLGLKLVVPTAEVLYDWQREQIERVFGCPVMNDYGGAEAQCVALECPAGRFHITHENVIVEILDAEGRAVPAGEPGFVTITSLCNMAMPLIRYQNGDIAAMEPNAYCECGRHLGLPVLSRIIGRSADVLLRTDGQPTHWTVIYYAIKDTFKPGMVVEHQARQTALDFIELSVVKGPKYDDQAMVRFLERIKSVLGQDVQLQLRFVDAIQREKSGKLRYFVSEISEAQQRNRVSQ